MGYMCELTLSKPLSTRQRVGLRAIMAGTLFYLDSPKLIRTFSPLENTNPTYERDIRQIDNQLKICGIEMSGQITCQGAGWADVYIIYVKDHKVERVDSVLVNAGPSWDKKG